MRGHRERLPHPSATKRDDVADETPEEAPTKGELESKMRLEAEAQVWRETKEPQAEDLVDSISSTPNESSPLI